MKMGRSIHFIGEPGCSWYEVKVLLTGRWPELHVARERIEGVALLEPATRIALMAADSVRAANWQRANDPSAPHPEPVAVALYPALEPKPDEGGAKPRKWRPKTAADLEKIRERIAHLRATSTPVEGGS